MASSDDLSLWRRARRVELLALRMAVPEAQHRAWNEAVTALLLRGFPLLHAATVGFYWPFKGEFDPRFVIHRLRQQGARVALPVVLQKNAPLEFREWWPGVAMVRGVFDLPIPHGTKVLQPGALLIPPVAEQKQTRRGGRACGGGQKQNAGHVHGGGGVADGTRRPPPDARSGFRERRTGGAGLAEGVRRGRPGPGRSRGGVQERDAIPPATEGDEQPPLLDLGKQLKCVSFHPECLAMRLMMHHRVDRSADGFARTCRPRSARSGFGILPVGVMRLG